MNTMSFRLHDLFVANVRDRMADLGINQSELAERLCVTPSYVSQILSGHRRPGLDSLDDFATALDTTPSALISARQKSRIPA